MSDLLRESIVGQLVNHFSGGRFLPYDDQRPGWKSPASPSREDVSPVKEKASEEGLSPYLVDWYSENDQDNPMYALQ